MSSCTITNPSIEPLTLPFPFAGILRGKQIVKFNVADSVVIAALGGTAAAGAVLVSAVPDGGPYDTAYQGSVGTSPVSVASLVVTGNSDLQGDVAVGDDFDVGAGNFTVDGPTGNAATLGTLDVAGTLAATGLITAADLTLSDDLIVGDDVLISGSLTVTELASTRVPYMGAAGLMKSEAALNYVEGTDTLNAVNFAGTTAALTGDVSAAGGFRQTVGPFTAPGAAGVTAAAQTNLDLRYSHTVTAAALSFIAKRAGSIMGLSAQLDAAVTGAGESIAVKVMVNGVEVGAGLDLAFTQAGAEVVDFAVVAKDTVAFVAGDIIGVSYTSTAGVTNTPALVASIEIEC